MIKANLMGMIARDGRVYTFFIILIVCGFLIIIVFNHIRLPLDLVQKNSMKGNCQFCQIGQWHCFGVTAQIIDLIFTGHI